MLRGKVRVQMKVKAGALLMMLSSQKLLPLTVTTPEIRHLIYEAQQNGQRDGSSGVGRGGGELASGL